MREERPRQDLRLRTKRFALRIIKMCETVKPKRLALLLQEADELMAIFSSMIKSSRNGSS